MLITFVVAYMVVTIAIGLLAARRVHGAKDYLVAGRSLPLYMNVAPACCIPSPASPAPLIMASLPKGPNRDAA